MNQTHEQLTKALTNATHVGVVGSREPIRRGLCRWLLASGFVLGLALPPVTTQGAISPAAAEQGEALSSAAQRIQPIQQELGSMLANVDESRDDFMRRVAGRIAAFTYASGHEVCGLIERERDFPHRYRVILRTNRSQVGCLQRPSKDPLFEPTGEGIHSHPLTEWVSLTAQDMRLRSHPQFWCGRSIRVAAAGFSDNDYNNGPGYLVVNDQLLHQAGRGTDRNLGPITITADDQQQMTAMAQQPYGAINCAQFAQARRALGLRVRP